MTEIKLGLKRLSAGLGSNQKWIAVEAEPDSPAARAGVQRGDVVKTIAGVDPAEWNRQGRSFPETGLRLEIVRGEKQIALVINHPSAPGLRPQQSPGKQLPSEAARAPLLEHALSGAEGKAIGKKFYAERERWMAQVRGDARIKDASLFRFLMFIAEKLQNKPGHPWHFMAFTGVGEIAAQVGYRKETVLELYKQAEALAHLRVHRGTGRGNPNRYEPVLWASTSEPPTAQEALQPPAEIATETDDQCIGEQLNEPDASDAVAADAAPPAGPQPDGQYAEGSEQWIAWEIFYRCCGHHGLPAEMILGDAPERSVVVEAEWPPVGRGLLIDEDGWWEVFEGHPEFDAWRARLQAGPGVTICPVESTDGSGRRCLVVPTPMPPPLSTDERGVHQVLQKPPPPTPSVPQKPPPPAVSLLHAPPLGAPAGRGLSLFERQLPEEREAMIGFCCRRYGWDEEHARSELKRATLQDVERLSVEMKLQVPRFQSDYDPCFDT